MDNALEVKIFEALQRIAEEGAAELFLEGLGHFVLRQQRAAFGEILHEVHLTVTAMQTVG